MTDLRATFILGRDEISKEKLQAVEISMLDYDFVNKSIDVAQLKDILQVLISEREGKYPDLEETVVNRILALLPEKERSRILSMSATLSSSEKERHKADLMSWVEKTARPLDNNDDITTKDGQKKIDEDIFPMKESTCTENKAKPNHQNYPPVRRGIKSTVSLMTPSSSVKPKLKKNEKDNKSSESKRISKENLSNREYFRAWDNFDFETAERMVDEHECVDDEILSNQSRQVEQKWQKNLDKQSSRSKLQIDEMRKLVSYSELTETERKFMASREKDKGNEFFRNKEYEESYTCYTKSLALDDQNAIVYANRAMVSIKLSNLCQAVSDCTQALIIDPDYTKALARRGMIHHKCGRYLEARSDFASCVNKEPENKEYTLLLKKSTDKFNEVNGEEKHEKTKTRVVVVEDDDSDSEQSETDDVIEEVFTPGSLSS